MASTVGSTTLGWSPAPSETSPNSSPMRGFARAGNGFAASQRRAWQDESHRQYQQQPRGPPPRAPMYRAQTQWQDWPELKILVRNLPPTVTTLELWQLFQKEGSIDFIRINTDMGSGRRNGSASIVFRPPPSFDFWTDKIWHMASPQSDVHVVDVSIDPSSFRPRMITSPTNRSRRYQMVTTLTPSALGFGVMTGEESMMIKKLTVANPVGELLFQVDLGNKSIVVTFNDRELRDGNQTPGQFNGFKFQIRFDELKDIKRVALEQDHSALIMSLEHPPHFYCQPPANLRESHKEGALMWSERDSWWRATDIIDVKLLANKVVSLSKEEEPILDMGRWLTYMLAFPNSSLSSPVFEQLESALRDFNIEINEVKDFERTRGVPVEVWKMMDRPVSNTNDDMHCLIDGGQFFNLPFEVRYQLEVCISHDVLEPHSITSEFLQALSDLVSKDKDTAQSVLEFLAVRGKRVYDPMTIFDDGDALAHSLRAKIPTYCAYARKAIITPTTMYLSTPTVEISNRVIRKYADYGDRFIRVQFTEENTRRRLPQGADRETNDALYTRVFRTLKNGIRVGDRHYQFLAFGNSQFREHGAYFFSPTDDLSCADIRKWMGNFTSIRNPAKYAARLGQCFSTTRAMKNRRIFVSTIPDVERNGHCFTDGVGKVSSFLMKLIQEELRLPEEPSVIQFRMGGCKGVLAMCPELKAYEVQIRKSQNKFPAEYNGLEIIRASQYSPATLNRQTITIFSSLGVRDEVFLGKLEEQLADYEEAVSSPEKADELLRKYIDEQHSTMAIAAIVHNGFMRSGDPFVNSLLHLWRAWSIKLLKEKARIIVEKSAFVFGCTDETQTLRGHTNKEVPSDGEAAALDINDLPQIFLQVIDPEDPQHTTVIEGICILGRNPSLHPGDIRVVQAIDVPALHHLRDVVVFSQLGDRDVPGMCSGGDLDGDDFFVIWDKDLIPREWNAESMVQPETPSNDLKRPVRIGDVMGFFVMYMKNDTLGQISNAHMAWADFLPDSVKDPKCHELAALASRAVDYVKSGLPAEMTKELRPRQWPHFMEKERGTYRSDRVVGQMYDKVVLVDFKPQYEMPFDNRVLDAYPEDKEMLQKARQLKSQYDSAVLRIMAQYGVETEFEVWTSFLMSKVVGASDYEQARKMTEVSDAMKDKFRTSCIEAAGGSDFKTLAPFVAAMYKVTSEEMEFALKECKMVKTVGGRQVPKREMKPKSMPLISFPWLFPDKLGRIATNSEPYELLDVDTEQSQPRKTRTKKGAAGDAELEEPEDIIQTADGVVHRGELLDLFNEVEHSDDEEETEDSTPSPAQLSENSTLLASIGVDADGGGVSPLGTRVSSPVSHAASFVTGPRDVRRPSFVGIDSDHEETLPLLETEEPAASRKASVASPAVDDVAEMQPQASSSLTDLAGFEEPITEEDLEILAKLGVGAKTKETRTHKQTGGSASKEKSISSTLMSMDEFDKLQIDETKRRVPATRKKWSSTTSDSEGLLTGQFLGVEQPQPSELRVSTPPLSISKEPVATSNSSLSTSSNIMVTPTKPPAAEKGLLTLSLATATLKQPSTPVIAPVYSKAILEPIDSLPSPQNPVTKTKSIPKAKPADQDTESRKTPFFAPKAKVAPAPKQGQKNVPVVWAVKMARGPSPAVTERQKKGTRADDLPDCDEDGESLMAEYAGSGVKNDLATPGETATDKLAAMVGELEL